MRKYPEKFAVYCILCNFAAVFQNCINSMETKYIHRELSAVIEEAYRYFSVITVTGPRQSGKTTLLRNLFSHLPYYSLENLDVRSFAENDPVAFLNQHTEGMILDEVHNARTCCRIFRVWWTMMPTGGLSFRAVRSLPC